MGPRQGFAFAHVADEGFIDSCAADLLRYRAQIGAQHIEIWADLKKKHAAHALTADVSLGETARAAQFMRADAVIITGAATAKAPARANVLEAKAHCSLPVLIGSGVNAANLQQFLPVADGFIVGSSLKRHGRWDQPVEPARLRAFLKLARR